MSAFLVCKVTPTDVVVVLNGESKTISRKFQEAQDVIALVKEYNGTGDVEKREELVKTISEKCVPKTRMVLQKSNDFEFDNDKKLYLKGTKEPIPSALANKIVQYVDQDLPVEALANFWRHLLLNPDTAVREQAFSFITHRDIAITSKGYLVCAKAVQIKRKYNKETGEQIIVREYDENTGDLIKEEYTHDMEFTPYHEGGHGMSIKIGVPVTMPREECDSNPNRTCSSGLHVGAIEYVKDFGREDGVILECLVSPRNIVSIPVDYNNTKMRCCEYYPIAITNGKNAKIYVENDYQAITNDQLTEELKQYAKLKAEAIQSIEEEYSELDMITTQIQNG